jgi:L,D-peptidoglycan transpeptidase YkuD (ErfK/YbiS/YcfS/YnhG family)
MAPMSVAAILSTVACFAGTQGSAQLVTVQAPVGSSYGTLSMWARDGACWRRVGGPWQARLGRSGLSAAKREGDGATPIGTYRLGSTVYGIAPDPGVRLPYHRIRCGDWWVSDVASPSYNRFRHVACWRLLAASEALWTITPQYRYFAVVEYNTDPVVPGRGSAIFLHVAAGATAGCVALPEPQLLRLLRWLRLEAKPLIRIGIS